MGGQDIITSPPPEHSHHTDVSTDKLSRLHKAVNIKTLDSDTEERGIWAGRHNIRDLSGARHTPQQVTIDQSFNSYEHLRLCTNDRVCVRGQFCDQHYGVCRDHMTEGQECREDAMCEGGYDCMFGVCQKRIKRGREGARCRKERDCGAGMCCARRHGEQVCQRRLPLGHKCYVPEGGLDYSMNQICPCESGLVCKYTAEQPPSRHQLIALISASEDMRCAAPSHRVD
ncbi:dickkopf-related protein 3-like [Penaeus chinensis]|uniref:dickkopf-related protein 3-like n=1 Tax=Penaeus chinensis TaxID=139456 RepID=UPI001FB5C882|nr:dickkopf-related protein 3-like [Penaeus chinensis]